MRLSPLRAEDFKPGPKGTAMDLQYDIFEKLPDGFEWRLMVFGHDEAISALEELAAKTRNECCLMHLPTKKVVATMNKS
jgi:hypothetical protein